jgi:hypothetical protein
MIINKKYSFIYPRFNLKLCKGQLLTSDEIFLDNFSALFFPIFL